MFEKESTRSIVARNRPTEQETGAETKVTGRSSPAAQSNSAPPAEPSVPDTAPDAPTQRPAKKPLPKWIIPTICTVLALLVLVLAILAAQPFESAAPQIPDGQSIIAVNADVSLISQAAPGDVVRLYLTDGQPIEALQYVQVYKATEYNQLLLLVDDVQASIMVSQEISPKMVIVSHGDAAQAAQMLNLQARINDPQITLTLQPSAALAPGQSLAIEIQTAIDPAEASLPAIQWISSDTAVATVDAGTIYAQAVGQAVITAICGDVQAECTVTVEVPLEAVALSQTEAVIGVGETVALTAAAQPENATHFNVSWSSADTNIATVAEDGTVTAVAVGSTTITATSGSVSAACAVTVGVHAEVVQLDKASLELEVAQTDKLTGTVYPASDVIDGASFASSDPEVATVAEDGTVTAVAPGSCTITFRCGAAEVTCPVVVEKAKD